MELSVQFQHLILIVAVSFLVWIIGIQGQINTPCSPSLLSTFTPCMNFVTNSSSNGTSPTSDCCNALKNLTSNSRDCLCLILTASVPFQIPINRTLAISLPRACNLPGVPVQCKASVAPIPAPGPVTLGPTLSPVASPGESPSVTVSPKASALPPELDNTTVITPPSTVDSEAPTTTTTGSRPALTPSAAADSYRFSSYLQLLGFGYAVFTLY